MRKQKNGLYFFLGFIILLVSVAGCVIVLSPSRMTPIDVGLETDDGHMSTPADLSTPVFNPIDITDAPDTPEPTVVKTPEPTVEPEPTQTAKQYVVDPDKPMVALTFDDGPGGKYTERILDLLEQYDGRATFFIVGTMAENHQSTLTRGASLNCEYGNHTYDHTVRLKGLTRNELDAVLTPVDELLIRNTGKRATLIRPPWGSIDDTVRAMVDRPLILWTVDTEDWKSRDKDMVFEHIKTHAFDGSIILMHDIYQSTVDACEMAIPWLVEQGYQLVTVSEMFEAKGLPLEAGHIYRSATVTPAPTATPAP